MRIKRSGNGRAGLRERIEWLLPVIQSGRYGIISTRNKQLERDYCDATGAPLIAYQGGPRAKQLNSDLGELAERGLLERQLHTPRGASLTYYVYTLTEQGAEEARALMSEEVPA
jgi:hypothetical protein